MDFIHLSKDDYNAYNYKKASNIPMEILGTFLICDVTCCIDESFFEMEYDEEFKGGCGNATLIEKENGYMYLFDGVPDPDEDNSNPPFLKMSCLQYVEILETWRDKVCIPKPSEVIIRHINNAFIWEIIP